MKRNRIAYLLLLIATIGRLLFPTRSNADNSPQEWHGSYLGPGGTDSYVIYTNQTWSSLWDRLNKKPPGNFDPTHQMALVVFGHNEPTGGYHVDILSLSPQGDHLVVEYAERPPSPEMFVIQAFTTPYVVRLVPLQTGINVVFKRAYPTGEPPETYPLKE